jgi:hypothetical protein
MLMARLLIAVMHHDPKAWRANLEQCGYDLHSLFSRTFARCLTENDTQYAWDIFRALLATDRALSFSELHDGMMLGRKPSGATLRRCVNQLKDLLILDKAGRVQIVHTSFRDYLDNALKERDKKGTP